MSTTKTGILETARTSPQGYFSFLMDGVWYGTYKDDHSDKIGRAVIFDATQKGEYWNARNVRVDPSAPAAPVATASAVMTPDARQSSIVLQSSYKTAAEVFGALLAADKVGLGNKKALWVPIATDLLDEIAVHIYNRCISPAEFLAQVAGAQDESEETDNAEYNPAEA